MSEIVPQEQMQNTLNLFVYGTLQRGCWNHDRFCRDAIHIEEAAVRGRLYELLSGIPVLQVPDSDVIAVGTTNPLADVAMQRCLIVKMLVYADPDVSG